MQTYIRSGALLLAAFAPFVAAAQQQTSVAYPVYSSIVMGDSSSQAQGVQALAVGSDGNYYGADVASYSDGTQTQTLFTLTPSGTYSTLYTFNAGTDGGVATSLISGASGALYGTTGSGGAGGMGTVFEYTAGGQFSVLHSFSGADGGSPKCVVQGSDGSLYGYAPAGGANSSGTLFKINSSGQFTTLYTFPAAGTYGNTFLPMTASSTCPVLAGDGNLYGATIVSNDLLWQLTSSTQDYELLQGTSGIYKLTPAGNFSMVKSVQSTKYYSFTPPNSVTGFYDTGSDMDGTDLVVGSNSELYGMMRSYSWGITAVDSMFRMPPGGSPISITTVQTSDISAGNTWGGSGASLFIPGVETQLIAGSNGSAGSIFGSNEGTYSLFSTGLYWLCFCYNPSFYNFAAGSSQPDANFPIGLNYPFPGVMARDNAGNLIIAAGTVIDRIVPQGDMTASASLSVGGTTQGTTLTVTHGNPLTINWSSTGAASCTFGGSLPDSSLGGSLPTSGSITITPETAGLQYLFYFQCTDSSNGITRAPLFLLTVG
jgi:uncharacterized repeat protein (TIGR03803 family)